MKMVIIIVDFLNIQKHPCSRCFCDLFNRGDYINHQSSFFVVIRFVQ